MCSNPFVGKQKYQHFNIGRNKHLAGNKSAAGERSGPGSNKQLL